MTGLADELRTTWHSQAASGFLLADPSVPVETRHAHDPATGVTFRFRWLPHRELRGDVPELVRRGILAARDTPVELVRDARDPAGRHCFLCPGNLRITTPAELLVPLEAAGRRWWAGANFAWLASNHFTVMTDVHRDQEYDPTILDAMVDIHRQGGGELRIVYNADGAGATIPWHLHLHVVTDEMPIEHLRTDAEARYPVPVHRFDLSSGEMGAADRHITSWIASDPRHHRVNLLVAGAAGAVFVYVVERDTRLAAAPGKGLMGAFEMAGDFAFSEPARRADFERADLSTARRLLEAVRPPASV